MKEDRQPLRKRIQDNDNEDDPGSQGEKKLEKMKEMFTKYLEELKNKQMNNTLEGINSSITEAEEQISDLEGRMVEINATE